MPRTTCPWMHAMPLIHSARRSGGAVQLRMINPGLLRQPGGFEGIVAAGIAKLHANDAAVVEREYVGHGLLHLDPAALPLANPTADHHDPITTVHELIRLDAELFPYLVPVSEHDAHALHPLA